MTFPFYPLIAGSSFSVYSATSWSKNVMDWLPAVYEQHFSNQAANGAKTWYNLLSLGDNLSANIQVVIIDTANDVTNTQNKDKYSLEAFIRRVWTYNPNIKIIGISAPSWNTQDISNDANAPTPTNVTDLNAAKTIFDYYGVSYVPYLDTVAALVAASTYHLNELVSVDTIHPTALGYTIMAQGVEAYLPTAGASLSGAMPARLYEDTEDFERTPQATNGTGYSGRTGTWSDSGTETTSSEADATITFTGTFRSFGWYNTEGSYPTVQVSIDGGAYADNTTTRNGYDIGTYAEHTVTYKVVTSMNIEKFWSI